MGARSFEAFAAGLAGTKTGPDSGSFLHGTSPGSSGRRHNLALYLQEMLERRPMLHGRGNHFGLFGSGKGYALPADAPALAAEPTATIMCQVLAELDFLPLLWSAYPLHPHLPGRPLSNRTPTAAETAIGEPIWLALAELVDVKSVVAVGNVADRSVRASGRTAPKVRHPAHGGKARFRLGLQELLAAGIDD